MSLLIRLIFPALSAFSLLTFRPLSIFHTHFCAASTLVLPTFYTRFYISLYILLILAL
jgi:hypothetical protein